MSIADKIRGWPDSDSLIMCFRAANPDTFCELCGHAIYAAPSSREKLRLPGWHVICRECVPKVRAFHELKFNGRFRTDEEARRVLPWAIVIDFSAMMCRCDICHQERPDAAISVHKVDIHPEQPGVVIRNVKFCNDSPACKEGAENWKEKQ